MAKNVVSPQCRSNRIKVWEAKAKTGKQIRDIQRREVLFQKREPRSTEREEDGHPKEDGE
jgi:hypothetical protein